MPKFTNGHYYSLNQYLHEQFGCKVYKLALSGGFTCPNRDGSLDTRGCIFCSAGGSGEFAADAPSVSQQIEIAKARVSKKISSGKYIAYFQSFTSTYLPTERLCAVSLATRPDCLPEGVLSIITRFNEIKPIWVELGLQTVNDCTAKYIRRGYATSVYYEAAEKLRSRGINTIVHVILGLPGESREDILSTVRCVGSTADGIKLQLLHVLKGTDLEQEYTAGKFDTLSQEEYIDLICACIEELPENIVIHRLTGDGDKRLLVAPLWSVNKKAVLNALNKEINHRHVIQNRRQPAAVPYS